MNSSRQFLLKLLLLAALVFLTGCGSSDNEFVSFDNPARTTANSSAPIATANSYNALGNTTLNVAANLGVLVNDTVNGSTITAFDNTTTQGGTVAVAQDGSFVYNPRLGFTGSDTFTYTLTGAGGQSTATVTLNSTKLFWYVNNTAGPAGNGTFATPFNTLAAAVNAAAVNETIFVLAGDNTSTGLTGPITLKTGQTLVGEAVGLNLDNILPRQLVAQGPRPQLVGPINLADGVTLRGLKVTAPPAGLPGIFGTSISDLTLDRVTAVATNTGTGISVSLDGNATINQSVLSPGQFRPSGTAAVNFGSTDTIYGGGSSLSGTGTSNTTATFTGDSGNLQIDATDNATVSSTSSNFAGSLSVTGSVTAAVTSEVSNSSLTNFQIGPFGTSNLNVTLTDCLLDNLGPSSTSAPVRMELTRVSQSAPGGFWDITSLQGVFVLVDCTVDSLTMGQAAPACLRSTGGTYSTVNLLNMTIENLANFATNNTVNGVLDTTGSVDGVCP